MLQILLALHDGAPTLLAQLESFSQQTDPDWGLLVGDDGSRDGSMDIVRAWQARHPEIRVVSVAGPCAGAAQNFLYLMMNLDPAARFVALSDQDDVWLPGKLARARAWLSDLPDMVPALYCARSIICDAELRPMRFTPLPQKPPGFRNALIQSLAAGHTMVLNRAGADLARAAASEAGEVVIHDWWLYQIVSGAGGTVLFDPEPQVLYRQHAHNQIGANDRLVDRIRRLRLMFRGQFREWNDIHIAALTRSQHRLTPENRAILFRFSASRRRPLPARLIRLAQLGLYRQSRIARAGFWLAAVLGRL